MLRFLTLCLAWHADAALLSSPLRSSRVASRCDAPAMGNTNDFKVRLCESTHSRARERTVCDESRSLADWPDDRVR